MRDEDFGATLTLAEGEDGLWSPSMAASVCEPCDWQSVYEIGAGPRGAGAGAGGRGASARRRVACGGEDRPFPCRFAEVELRPEPGQARGGGRGGQDGPPHGEGRAVLPVGSGAAGEAAFGGRRRFAQAQHAHVAAHGSRPVAPGFAGVGGREGHGCCAGAQDRADAQARRGHDQDAAPGSRFPDPGERPVGQGAGTRAGAQGRARVLAATTLDEVGPLEMRTVVRETREGRLWNGFVAQMRYAVHDRNGWPLAMLGFSTAAWKLAPRDSFIGWPPELREKNLPLVVDNGAPRWRYRRFAGRGDCLGAAGASLNVAGTAMRVVVATRPVDFRKGVESSIRGPRHRALKPAHAASRRRTMPPRKRCATRLDIGLVNAT